MSPLPVVVDLGQYTYGDIQSDAVLTVKDRDGNAIDLTSATDIILQCKSLDGADSFALACTGANGSAAVTGLAVTGIAPPAGKITAYMARLHYDLGDGSVFVRADYRFRIENFAGTDTLSEPAASTTFFSNLSRLNMRPLFGPATYPRLRGTNTSGTYVGYVSRGGSHVYDSYDAPLQGRVEEFGDACGQKDHPDVEEGMTGWTFKHWIIELWFSMDGIRQAGGLVANRMMGWQVGSLDADPPFASAPALPVIQARLNLRNGGMDDVSLYVAKGDGVTAGQEERMHLGQESGVTGLQAQFNLAHKIRLEHVPSEYVKLTMWDAFDAKFKSVQVDAPSLPQPGTNATGFGIFSCTGTSGACGNQFSMSNGMLYVIRDDWGEG